MSHQRVETGQGWNWYARGWEIFMKNPGIWIVLALILFVIYFVLNLIPLIGGLAAGLLAPALFGGLLYGARELDHDRSLEIPHLFQAFRDSDRTVPMVLLGLVPLAAGLVMGLVAVAFGVGVAGMAAVSGSGGATAGMAIGGGIIYFLMIVIMALVVGALMMFAVPRVMFGHAEPIAAVTDSVKACIANIGAFVVFALLYVVFAVLATIPFGLGFLILMPVMAGAVYSANKEVFGAGDPTEEMPGAGEPEPAPEPPASPEPGSEGGEGRESGEGGERRPE